MEYKRKYLTTAEMILKNHSGWSGVKCETCHRATTNAQLAYSLRLYRKPLCRSCQSLESYRVSFLHKQRGGENNGNS